MNHECVRCCRSFEYNSGQVVRRRGKYICSDCYSSVHDGLSPVARASVIPKTPISEKISKPVPKVVSKKKPLVVEPLVVIGEPIFEDDDEFDF